MGRSEEIAGYGFAAIGGSFAFGALTAGALC
jgi:hypothetical protein